MDSSDRFLSIMFVSIAIIVCVIAWCSSSYYKYETKVMVEAGYRQVLKPDGRSTYWTKP